MNDVKDLFVRVRDRLLALAEANAVVAKPISVGDRHVVPLCELRVGLGGGGGEGEGEVAGADKHGRRHGKGEGGGAGGGVKALPIAVIVVEGGKARIERLG